MTIKIEAGTGEGKNETEQKPGKTAARGEEGKGREKELVDWRKGERESGCIAKRGGERENVESRATHARHAISLSLSLFLRREKFHRFLLEKRERFRKEFHPFPLYGWFQKKKRKELVEERNGGEEENAHFLFPSFRKKMLHSKNIPHLPSLSERNRDTTRINRV